MRLLAALTITLVPTIALAGRGGGGGIGHSSSGSTSSSNSSSHSSGSSSSSSSSSSGSSRSSGSSGSSSSGSSGHSSAGGSRSWGTDSGSHGGGGGGSGSHGGREPYAGTGGGRTNDTWGDFHGDVRDHRHPEGNTGPIVRDHRHPPRDTDGAYPVLVDNGYDASYVGYNDSYDVVGYRNEGYGSWGKTSELPAMTFELGARTRHFNDPVGSMNTIAGDGGYNVEGGNGADNALVSEFRFIVGLKGPIYLGGEGEIGGLVSAPPVRATADRLPDMEARSATVLGGYGIIGARSRSGNTTFGVEVAAGGRGVLYAFKGHGTEWSANASTGVVEPRARAEYWLSPFITVGATVGANVVQRGDWNAGGFLAFHTRAFGGD